MDDDRSPEPGPPPADRRLSAAAPGGRNPLATPAGAGALGLVVVVLAVATIVASGVLPAPSSSPAGPSPTDVAVVTPSPTSGPPTPTPLPTFVHPTPTPLPTFTTYVVQPGDSLNSIARQFGTTARSLAWWNRGTYPNLDPQSPDYEPDHIEPGWTLVLIPGTVVDDGNPPTPSPAPPTPVPTAGPSATPTATPVPGSPATVVSHGPRGTATIALTFDMGGRLDPAVDIVQWLIDHDVHATLFPTGSSGTTTDLGKQALELAATRPDLFAIGNHSWSHPDFTTLSAAQMGDQLKRTDDAIYGLIGRRTTPWFRPPYGAWTYDVRVGVGAAGWARLVMWDVDTIDWKPTADGGPTADDIVTKVLANGQGGSIVLMHLGGYHTLEALPDLLDGLRAKGLAPVTLREMLGD